MKKPTWKATRGGWGAPPLPSTEIEYLERLLVNSLIPADDRRGFIEACCDGAALVRPDLDQKPVSDSKIWDSLEALRIAGNDLLAAMRALPEEAALELNAAWRLVAWRSRWLPDDPRSKRVRAMPQTWDLVEALRDAAIEATLRVKKPTRGKKAGEDLARSFVFHAATCVHGRIHRWPPRTKGKWFHAFVNALGARYGLVCGDDLVHDVVSKAASNTSKAPI